MEKNILNSSFKKPVNSPYKKYFLMFGSLMLCGFFTTVAHANGLNFLTNKIKSKVSDVSALLIAVGLAALILGVLYIGYTYLEGRPNYKYAVCVVVAGAIFATAGAFGVWVGH